MLRQAIRLVSSVLVLSASALAGVAGEPHFFGAPPNVLFIAIDDLRPELGCYGATVAQTPHLDRLAGRSLRFDRAYCQVPVCGASRASLLTSILPTRQRYVGFDAWAERDAPGTPTLPQVFREAGYTTLASGKIFHHPADTADRSWSEPVWNPAIGHLHSHDPSTTAERSAAGRGRLYESPDVPDDAYKDGQVAHRLREDLRRLAAAGRPFFLAGGFSRPHLPFYAPQRYWDRYNRATLPLAAYRERPAGAPSALRGSSEYRTYAFGEFTDGTEEFHRMMLHGYLASVSYVDELLGGVLDELARLGLAENTIVVVWSDHGWHLGEHGFWGKHNTLHRALRVPLLVSVPGRTTGGATAARVELLDLFPTLCELAGLKPPPTVQGRSFAAVLGDPQREFRDVVYSRFGPGEAVIAGNFIYTSYGQAGEMLFDLQADPDERQNLAGREDFGNVLATMRQHLRSRQEEAARAHLQP